MVNKLKLKMNQSRSIQILVNKETKHIITSNNRVISAKQIYDLLDYKKDQQYEVEMENNHKVDEVVLDYFKKFFCDICDRINQLASTENEVEE